MAEVTEACAGEVGVEAQDAVPLQLAAYEEQMQCDEDLDWVERAGYDLILELCSEEVDSSQKACR